MSALISAAFVAATNELPAITDDDCNVILQDWDESNPDQRVAMRLAAELLIARNALRSVKQWNDVSAIDDEWPLVMEEVGASLARSGATP